MENNLEEDIYLHEDLFCQVELLPRENKLDLKIENEKIEDFGNEHSDGHGYTDVYVRGDQKLRTFDRQIAVEDFENMLLSLGFAKRKNVYSGYSAYREFCANTNAYTIGEAAIFCDYEDNIIKNIWIDGFRFNEESSSIPKIVEGLYQVATRWNLTLNDWDLCETIDIQNKESIEIYIKDM